MAAGALLLSAQVVGQRNDDSEAALLNLLTAYEAGKYELVERALSTQRKAPLAAELIRSGDRWIKNGPAAAIDRRRMIAGAVALEIVGAGLTDEWYSVYEVIEWACRRVIDVAPGSAAELTWHLGSISLLQSGSGVVPTSQFVRDHVAQHVLKREPASGRVRLAVTSDQEHDVFAPRKRPDQAQIPPEVLVRFRSAVNDIASQYSSLASLPDVSDEATLRLGAFYARVELDDLALNVLAPLTRSSDAFAGHIAQLLIGDVLRRKGRYAEAAAAYRVALKLVPNAMSASLGLSAALAAAGDMDGAIEAVAGSATAAAPVDPWRLFAYGDGRLWPELRDQLRRQVRQ